MIVEEVVEDPWQPGVGSQDPWKSSTQSRPTAVASPTLTYQIDFVSAQLEEQHRAYLATRLDLTQLFQSDNGSREVPPPTDEPGVAKPMGTAEFVIGTPVQSRSPGWRRRKKGSDSLSSSPPVRGKRPATADAATSPIHPAHHKHTPTHVQDV